MKSIELPMKHYDAVDGEITVILDQLVTAVHALAVGPGETKSVCTTNKANN